mmetsp:Transcript_22450/g.31494  ORF Transcript_22450/g.31494 Transcript_22450/m.31494 type:complete len:140 (-) Transcript_22450:431-850(-)
MAALDNANEMSGDTLSKQEDQYEQYFTMLANGVELQNVRKKMREEGLNPNDLDNFQYEIMFWNDQSSFCHSSREEKKILYGEHSKYIKMIKVGLPLEAVLQRMEIAGLDPSTLDVELYHRVKQMRAASRDDDEQGWLSI